MLCIIRAECGIDVLTLNSSQNWYESITSYSQSLFDFKTFFYSKVQALQGPAPTRSRGLGVEAICVYSSGRLRLIITLNMFRL